MEKPDVMVVKRRDLESLLKNMGASYSFCRNCGGDEHVEVEVTRNGRVMKLPYTRPRNSVDDSLRRGPA